LPSRVPHGIVSWSDGKQAYCQSKKTLPVAAEVGNTTKSSKSSESAAYVMPESSVTETPTSTDYCLHSGVLFKQNGSIRKCQCPQGYGGDRCDVSACHNYCLNEGKCQIDYSGLPACICVLGTNGSRCERRVCDGYCLNGATCHVDRVGQPTCKCKGNFSGVHCEVTSSEHPCQSYCRQLGQLYVPIDGGDTPMCM
jgi:hypothetical protein